MAAKLDAADTPTRSKTLSTAAVRTIQEYRREHSMTQDQLNTTCGFPANTIKKLELRTVAPDMRQLQTLNRILKTGLTLE
jgi:DNA-binding XRE family transcriptional regulator